MAKALSLITLWKQRSLIQRAFRTTTIEASNGFYRTHKRFGIMEAGYTETGNDTEKTTEHFTSSYEGNNVLLMLQGNPFSFDSVCGSPFPSLWVSSCCDSDRRVSRPPGLVSNASAGSRLRGSRSAKEYQRTQATALNESWVFLCAFL